METKDCKNCSNCNTIKDQLGWEFLGCHYGEYKNKWVAEIKECPKTADKNKVLSFIKERSKNEYGTTKKCLYKEFKNLDSKEIDKLVKELKDEEEIFLAPLINESTGMFAGRCYVTSEIF